MKIKFDKILGMLREEDESTIIGGDSVISGHVTSYANLPDALTYTGQYYIVDTNTGTWILGTLKSAGIYKSNGTTWVYIDSVPETTSLSDGTTVITGTNIILEGGKNISSTTNTATNRIVFNTDDILNADAIQFNTLANEACAEGKMAWDTESGTIKIGMLGGDVCLNLGQEQFIYVKNTSGSIITNGTPVYISGASGANIEIAKADASSQENCRKTIAVATEDIAINGFGYVTTFGYVRDINTGGFTEGGEVYIAVGGGYTQTRPALPNCIVKIGVCARANTNNGVIHTNITPVSRTEVLTDTGDLTIRTQANKTVVLEQPVWDDLNFSPVNSGGPAASRPDDVTINNVFYKEFTNLNSQSCGDQKEMPHNSNISGATKIYPHAHIFLKQGESAGTTGVTFTIYWEMRENGNIIRNGSVALSATSAQLTANSAKINISDATGFDAPTTLGGQLALRIARTGGNAGDVVVTTYGVHYAIDTVGSRTISSK